MTRLLTGTAKEVTAIHCAGTLHRQLTQSSNRLGTIQPSFVVVVVVVVVVVGGGGGGGASGVVVLCPLRKIRVALPG